MDNERHTRLGTLGHLPSEVRDMIYGCLFTSQVEQVLEAYMQSRRYLVGDREKQHALMKRKILCFNIHHAFSSYPPDVSQDINIMDLRWYGSHVDSVMELSTYNIHLASNTLRNQYEDHILRHYTFKFTCPIQFGHFIDRLSTVQLSSLKHIILEIYGDMNRHCCAPANYHTYNFRIHDCVRTMWMDVFGNISSRLHTLTSVNFYVGGKQLDCTRYGDKGRSTWEMDDLVGREPLQIRDVTQVVEVLDLITKGMQRLAPNAKISMPELAYYQESVRDALTSVLSELE